MATFSRNSSPSTLIQDSTINIDSLNNVNGVNPESIITFLPKEHDYSGHLAANNKSIILEPKIAPLTEAFFEIYLDGYRLNKDLDYYLSFNPLLQITTITINEAISYQDKTSLIFIYIDKQII